MLSRTVIFFIKQLFMNDFDYDLLVIGSGPGGQRAAIQASKLGKRCAVAEYKDVVGGVCINTGTIPSKTMREAAMHLSGYGERNVYGASYRVQKNITMKDLHFRTTHVIRNEIDVVRDQLQRNGVDMLSCHASFADPHTIRLKDASGHAQEVTAEIIVIAVGTNTAKDEHIAFDGQRIFTSDDILTLKNLPSSIAIVGAGVIGSEYATIFAILGARVTLIDLRPKLLSFVDGEIIDSLVYQLRQNRGTMRMGEEVSGIEPFEDERGEHVCINLSSGKKIVTEMALYSVGRVGATANLGLENTDIKPDSRGKIVVNENYQTDDPKIYAVGDVIGFPSLASTSMEQGRLAACHAFGVDSISVPELFPYGIYTVPEISTVGKNEEELTESGIQYEVGRATFNEIARGQITGDSTGLLKILFDPETRKLLGVHIIGEGACDLIHIGQAVMAMGGTMDYFINTVFNYPTLAESYKTAAFDGINRLG